MNSIRRNVLGVILLCPAFVGAAAAAADDPQDSRRIAFFEKQIRPLLASKCYSCHSVRAGKSEGDLVLDSRSGWETGGTQGPAVVPGDPDASLLIQAVRYTDGDLQMPPDRRLSKAEVARLEQWVRLGAPDPRDGPATLPTDQIDPSDPIAGRAHWAFQPLHTVGVPDVTNAAWPRTPIDAFVLAELERGGLTPAADADRLTLLRRVSVRLTGLPPMPARVAAFLEDQRPDAFERLVDELLSSPQFGERWGRHWLDLARYADSNGLDENFLFREAWRYRNWVITAINEDIPFDRFLCEQIAGDLLPYDSIEQRDRQRIAAGFLVLGPKVLLGVEPERQRMDVADEQIDTLGRAVLGQTLGCARCHDHKFDPVPTADYYALAGILTSTKVMERRYMLGQQRVMEQLVGLGQDGDAVDEAYEKYWRERPKLQKKVEDAKSVLEALEKQDDAALEKLAKDEPGAFSDAAADSTRPQSERLEDQKAFVMELAARLQNPPAIPPRAMIPTDVSAPADEHIRLAGEFDQKGEPVPRGFLQVLSALPASIPDEHSGRLELAHWLTDVEHGAGQLTARVLANRVWHHMMGRGLVRTVDNFGRTGEPPTHPALLDYLAAELIESGWSVKQLVRRIALSRTFSMSSRHDEAAHELDPENRLLWRAHRRRLDPETLRDAMLAAAGQLELQPMESSVWYLGDQATAVGDNKNRRRTDFNCRSVYLPVIRNDLPELFDVFDFADPHATTGVRPETMVATQGLFMLNDESVMSAAEATARRLITDDRQYGRASRADRMFVLILNVPPTEAERRDVLTFIDEMTERLRDSQDAEAEVRAWTMGCHALFASSRFQILE